MTRSSCKIEHACDEFDKWAKKHGYLEHVIGFEDSQWFLDYWDGGYGEWGSHLWTYDIKHCPFCGEKLGD